MGLLTRKSELSRSETERRLAVVALVGCAMIVAFASARADWGDWSWLDADPPHVDFGKQATGGTSAPRKVTVSNHSDKIRTIVAVRTTVATELYDPVANSFAVGPSMNTGRELTANPALLPNGKVLIAGGWVFGSGVLASTELYDPVSNSFAAMASTASMSGPREFSTATLLPNGEVLIAGGDNGDENLASSELYTP